MDIRTQKVYTSFSTTVQHFRLSAIHPLFGVNVLPIHRWLTFSDSWPPSEVELLLNALNVEQSEIVHDPFVGSGTTSVCAAERGLSTYSADISSLAALTTQTKLHWPSTRLLTSITELIHSVGVEPLLHAHVAGTLEQYVLVSEVKFLQFVISAGLLRVGWHEEVDLDFLKLEYEFFKLLREIREDVGDRIPPQQSHRVCCCEFYASNPSDVIEYSSGPVVMITSIPFFGSNFNPRKQRIDRLIASPIMRPSEIRQSPTFVAPEASILLDLVASNSEFQAQVAGYLFFLDGVATYIAELGCRAAAIEIGPTIWEGKLLDFDHFFAQRLEAKNFRVEMKNMNEFGVELISVVFATQR